MAIRFIRVNYGTPYGFYKILQLTGLRFIRVDYGTPYGFNKIRQLTGLLLLISVDYGTTIR